MAEGIVVSYKQDRGFGFINPDGEDNDIWFHTSAQVDHDWVPMPGDRVQFEIGDNGRGPAAVAIVRTEAATPAEPGRHGEELTGVVKWYSEQKEYGFIEAEGS